MAQGKLGDTARSMDARENTKSPIKKTRLEPKISPSRPASGIIVAKASANPAETQTALLIGTENSIAILGVATLTILLLIVPMNVAPSKAISANHLCGEFKISSSTVCVSSTI